ncbi:Uncharacterised protein [Mycobacteroides abscessus subsp. abscessus]|nr:Uncharacterised protein [Mycobacteroides abscessus subsp. abscessus]
MRCGTKAFRRPGIDPVQPVVAGCRLLGGQVVILHVAAVGGVVGRVGHRFERRADLAGLAVIPRFGVSRNDQ